MPDLLITDHALVRYMTRVLGIDMEAVRADFQRELAKVAPPGARSVPFAGHYAIIHENQVTTIVPNKPDTKFRQNADRRAGTNPYDLGPPTWQHKQRRRRK